MLSLENESTVVLVDDILEVRYLLRILLANVRRCHVVGEAQNGREAITVAAELRPHILILDVQMPVMDGLEALPRIRGVSPETKVIVYSSAPDAREEALALGAFGYLEKGVDPQRLVEAVREAALG